MDPFSLLGVQGSMDLCLGDHDSRTDSALSCYPSYREQWLGAQLMIPNVSERAGIALVTYPVEMKSSEQGIAGRASRTNVTNERWLRADFSSRRVAASPAQLPACSRIECKRAQEIVIQIQLLAADSRRFTSDSTCVCSEFVASSIPSVKDSDDALYSTVLQEISNDFKFIFLPHKNRLFFYVIVSTKR